MASNYDPNGEYNNGSGGLIAFILCFIGFIIFVLLKALWEYLGDWGLHDIPYNFISAFYYYLIVITIAPFQFIPFLAERIIDSHLTSYPNLNIVIAWTAVLLYIGVLLRIFFHISSFIFIFFKKVIAYIILLTPALIGFSCFFIQWLFTK